MEKALDRLLNIISEIAKGNYSNDIMPLTAEDQPEPIRSIAEAMGMMMVKVEAREYQLEMLIEEMKELNKRIRWSIINVVSTMANALATRDPYTEGHVARVGDLAGCMAKEMGLDDQEVEFVRLGGILHDIGKIGFTDRIFQATDKKPPSDMMKEIMRHPQVGAEILGDLEFLGPAVEYVRCHHERPDGKGYPGKLKGEDIPLGAKILAVADSFDAMTTDRTYQKALSVEAALDILNKQADAKWDGRCVAALEAVLGHGGRG